MRRCPRCGSKAIGKIGNNQYYCWDCCVEFNEKHQIFNVSEDGSLIALEG